VHHMSYEEAVKKLSLIKPGTKYDIIWDSKGVPHMHLDQKIDFAGGVHHVAGGNQVAGTVASATPESVVDHASHVPTPESQPDFSGDVSQLKNETYLNMQDVQHHHDALAEQIAKESPAVNSAIANHMDRFHDAFQGHPELLSQLQNKYDLTDTQLHKLFGEAKLFDNANGIKMNTVHAKELIFGKPNGVFGQWQNVRMEDITDHGSQPQAFIDSLKNNTQKAWFKKMMEIAPPQSGDSVRKWLVRGALKLPQMMPPGQQ